MWYIALYGSTGSTCIVIQCRSNTVATHTGEVVISVMPAFYGTGIWLFIALEIVIYADAYIVWLTVLLAVTDKEESTGC